MPEATIKYRSCISDQPLLNAKTDTLKNDKYAKGLLAFIKTADAPITIGIQGGWGSGKTSLMNMLKNALEDPSNEEKSLCINLNAWQQSLFIPGNGGDIALALLDSVHSGLSQQIENNQLIDKKLQAEILDPEGALKKAGRIISGAIIRGSIFAARTAARSIGIETPEINIDEKTQNYKPSQMLKQLRDNLNDITNKLAQHTSIKRLVIFVDDLDRIQPNTAIEILDVLKNIFDIDNCISILAVDYEVIIKGLREKFGEKNHENEREFRQYFDKIIQIPFSMPTAAYQRNLHPLLQGFFDTLSINIATQDQKALAEIAWKATDGVPRSVKRIVNTMSLLRAINAETEQYEAQEKFSEDSSSTAAGNSKETLIKLQFIIVCLQINFPEIHKELAKEPNFLNWTISSMTKGQEIASNAARTQDSQNKNEWENATLAITSRQPWLKTKTEEILHILNALRIIISKTDDGQDLLREVLNSVSITNTSIEPFTKGNKQDTITLLCREAINIVLDKLNINDFTVDTLDESNWAKQRSGYRELTHYTNNSIIPSINLVFLRKEKKLQLHITTKPPYGNTSQFREEMQLCIDREYHYDRDSYYIEIPITLQANQPHIDTLKFEKNQLPTIMHIIETAVSTFRKYA